MEIKKFENFVNEGKSVNWGVMIKRHTFLPQLSEIQFDGDYAYNVEFDADQDPRISVYTAYSEIVEEYVVLSVAYAAYPEDLDNPMKPYLFAIADPYGNVHVEEYGTFEEGLKRLGEVLNIRSPKVVEL